MLCDDSTEEECLRRNLFGDMARRLENLDEIEPGDMGFLLNINRDELIGIFRACSEAQLHIEPKAWNGRFAAQVRVEPVGELQRIKRCCVYSKEGRFGNETVSLRGTCFRVSGSRTRCRREASGSFQRTNKMTIVTKS